MPREDFERLVLERPGKVIENLDSLLLRRATLPPGACLGCTSPCGADSTPCDELVQLLWLPVRQYVPNSFFFGDPLLCSRCSVAVAGACLSATPRSLATLALHFSAEDLLACGEAHRDALAKEMLGRRSKCLRSLDEAIEPLIMPTATLATLKVTLERGKAAWPMERMAALTCSCFDELGLRCFLSADQAAELLAVTGAACIDEICHRILDRWHITRVLGPLGPACEYGLSWDEPHTRAQLERYSAHSEPIQRRTAILAGIYLNGERALDAARAGIGSTAVAASKCMRRDQLLCRWRRVTPLVGAFACVLRALFNEVHFRPDGEGARQAQVHFEAVQSSVAPLTPVRVQPNVPSAAAASGGKRSSPTGLTPLVDRLSARRPGSPLSPSIAKPRRSKGTYVLRC